MISISHRDNNFFINSNPVGSFENIIKKVAVIKFNLPTLYVNISELIKVSFRMINDTIAQKCVCVYRGR